MNVGDERRTRMSDVFNTSVPPATAESKTQIHIYGWSSFHEWVANGFPGAKSFPPDPAHKLLLEALQEADTEIVKADVELRTAKVMLALQEERAEALRRAVDALRGIA